MEAKIDLDGTGFTPSTAYTRIRGGGYGGNAWLAHIVGLDEKFGLARKFVQKDSSGVSGSGGSGTITWPIAEPGIYEFRNFCIGSTHRNWEWGGFMEVTSEGVQEISKADAIERVK